MKKYLLLLMAGLILTAPNVFAEDDEEIPQDPPETTDPPIKIPINKPAPKPNDDDSFNPRSLTPISGMYINGVVELSFAANMGAVSVTVVNTTNGNMWFETGDSSDGVIATTITPSAGSYLVTIETQTAGTFVGEFVL